MIRRLFCLLAALCCGIGGAHAVRLDRIDVLTEQLLLIVLHEGEAVAETAGDGTNGKIESFGVLDTALAEKTGSWQVEGPEGAAIGVKFLGRKSKGVAFARTAEWDIGHALGHWIYLQLDAPLPEGVCTVKSPILGADGIKIDPSKAATPLIQLNQVGYLPKLPKYAYASQWMGSGGALDLKPYADKEFRVVEADGGKAVLEGKAQLRWPKDREEGNDGRNLRNTDLWQLDFSELQEPGRYVIEWRGVGRSLPFEIGDQVYKPAYKTALAGLFHQRCGCELKAEHTKWPRPRCHHAKVELTKHRYTTASNAFEQLPKAATGEKRALTGGYHDAGDWDRHSGHLSVADELLLVFEALPKAFKDGDLSIPESNNGVPDIVDEARWGVDFFLKMQNEDGGVMAGIETPEHPKFGETSWKDSFPLYAYSADPQASFRFAASAASLARAYQTLRMEGLADRYLKAAKKAWSWAWADDDAGKYPDARMHAAASLFAATGEDEYHSFFKRHLKVKGRSSMLEEYENYDQRFAAWIYASCKRPEADAGAKAVLAKATEHYARSMTIETAAKRGRRQGYNWWKPYGHTSLTLPDNLALVAAHSLTGDERYLEQMALNCDAPLGANQLGICWMTGLGANPVTAVLHIDSWYDKIAAPVPGVVPYGPRRWEADPGWTHGFGTRTFWPKGEDWPREELWTENYMSPASAEFTVYECQGPAAAAMAYLYGVGLNR